MTTESGRWICVYWSELEAEIHDRRPGPGRVVLPPPVSDVSFVYGLWQDANDQLGTIFDQYEDDEIEPKQCAKLAAIVRVHLQSHFGETATSRIVVTVGEQIAPVARPVLVEVAAADMARHLTLLAEFLEDAAENQKRVTIAL